MGAFGSRVSTPSGAYKCVVIGETGSGKTAFLNLIGNIRKVSQLAEKAELSLDTVEHLHKKTKTDIGGSQGKSQTKKAQGYKIRGIGIDLTIIDTPGFGDTEGLDEDKRHVDSINDAIQKEDAINCIILVINGRVKRVTPQLRYVLANVCSILPKKILEQVVVVFTQVADLDDDLLFEPENLTEFLGRVPEDRQLFIDNPYAKVCNLIEKGSKNTTQKLKVIKNGFREVTETLFNMFKNIADFQAVETFCFTELYNVKKKIELAATKLNRELRNLNDDKQRLLDLRQKLSDTKTAKEAVKDFVQEQETTYWTYEETPGVQNMICAETDCKSNCHRECKCKIARSISDKTVFKNCTCFRWRNKKMLRIISEVDRQTLMNQLEEWVGTVVDGETQETVKDKTWIISQNNFSLRGVAVRGDPDPMWCSTAFLTAACSKDDLTLRDLREKSLPFAFQMGDWSNMERGEAMLCRHCNHPLASHSHQTCLHVQKSKIERHVDESKKKDYEKYAAEEKTQKQALEQLKRKLKDLESEEEATKKKLRENLQAFAQLGVASSYIQILDEQTKYLEILLKDAKPHQQSSLVSQLEMIAQLKAGADAACATKSKAAR